MVDRFLEFIKKHALIDEKDDLLLAVSGGVDSMVLFNLILQTKHRFAVAHCNFQLRGEQADLDEILVKEACESNGIKNHSVRFETKKFASAKGISTQMAARELRFDWFRELCSKFGYTKIVLAHHRDDSIETFFLNLSRGTSLKGLRGIQARNENLIRPLLPFSKKEIVDYATRNGIAWREDVSNEENYYKRNLIRHELLPVFKELNPDFEKVMSENLEKLEYRYQTSERHYDDLRASLIEEQNNQSRIVKSEILEQCASAYDLYEVLRPFSFNFDTAEQLFESLDKVGVQFKSDSYFALVDREYVLIEKRSTTSYESFELQEGEGGFSCADKHYHLSVLGVSDWKLDRNPEHAALDLASLQFPLEIRPWQEGDAFRPIGMKGRKLISDLLIDLKVPLSDKPKVHVLLSNDEIAWVIGFRISEKFKVSEKTRKVWQAKLKNN
ncbi:tRNA lysidine(34) synthetase TilS [uncultured Roseivirga sp.]|uniref:tRNA lysidine(34) synthetase TilS n=1 Tax=uncultured Roseivirga sp. TaxID=543088 RepID=UPI000D7B1194|nr:tRNA lysidine(34) synthetase TilS [uncultured Roseivirga sp.]PWL24609.1 MAG: tRNA lysidine(34) synthetase TilS [Roseivirga sp. XM-24bin3]